MTRARFTRKDRVLWCWTCSGASSACRASRSAGHHDKHQQRFRAEAHSGKLNARRWGVVQRSPEAPLCTINCIAQNRLLPMLLTLSNKNSLHARVRQIGRASLGVSYILLQLRLRPTPPEAWGPNYPNHVLIGLSVRSDSSILSAFFPGEFMALRKLARQAVTAVIGCVDQTESPFVLWSRHLSCTDCGFISAIPVTEASAIQLVRRSSRRSVVCGCRRDSALELSGSDANFAAVHGTRTRRASRRLGEFGL